MELQFSREFNLFHAILGLSTHGVNLSMASQVIFCSHCDDFVSRAPYYRHRRIRRDPSPSGFRGTCVIVITIIIVDYLVALCAVVACTVQLPEPWLAQVGGAFIEYADFVFRASLFSSMCLVSYFSSSLLVFIM